jgi:hypothetical protein
VWRRGAARWRSCLAGVARADRVLAHAVQDGVLIFNVVYRIDYCIVECQRVVPPLGPLGPVGSLMFGFFPKLSNLHPIVRLVLLKEAHQMRGVGCTEAIARDYRP